MKPNIVTGGLYGSSLDRLMANNMSPSCLRPYIGDDERTTYIDQPIGLKNGVMQYKAIPVHNVTATLRKEDWIHFDSVLVKVARERLNAQADLRSRGLTYTIPDGMGSTVLQTETMGDVNDAVLSMDALAESPDDRQEYELSSLPLPIIHKDFHFSARQIAASRKSGTPLDTGMLEISAQKVAEQVEKLLLGRTTFPTYGGGTLQGYTNWSSRQTATITAPTASGWGGSTLLSELLAMRKQLTDVYRFGPYMIYTAPAWDQYLDADYTSGYPKTVRNRILEVRGFEGIKTLDYLQNNDILMVQMTSDVIRSVIGMDMTTVQWDEAGGMKKMFKVMTIQVPQLRTDQNSSAGLVHASS